MPLHANGVQPRDEEVKPAALYWEARHTTNGPIRCSFLVVRIVAAAAAAAAAAGHRAVV